MSAVRAVGWSSWVAAVSVALAAWATWSLGELARVPLGRLVESGDPMAWLVLGAVPGAWVGSLGAVALIAARARRPSRFVAVPVAMSCAALGLVAGYGGLGLYLVAVIGWPEPSPSVLGGLAALPLAPLAAAAGWLVVALPDRRHRDAEPVLAVASTVHGPDAVWVDAPSEARGSLLAAMERPGVVLPPVRFHVVDRPTAPARDDTRPGTAAATGRFDEIDGV